MAPEVPAAAVAAAEEERDDLCLVAGGTLFLTGSSSRDRFRRFLHDPRKSFSESMALALANFQEVAWTHRGSLKNMLRETDGSLAARNALSQ